MLCHPIIFVHGQLCLIYCCVMPPSCHARGLPLSPLVRFINSLLHFRPRCNQVYQGTSGTEQTKAAEYCIYPPTKQNRKVRVSRKICGSSDVSTKTEREDLLGFFCLIFRRRENCRSGVGKPACVRPREIAAAPVNAKGEGRGQRGTEVVSTSSPAAELK